MATDAGHTNDGVHETENTLNVLDWHNLPIMDLLCFSRNDSLNQTPYESWSLFELIYTLKISLKGLGVCQESLDELSPTNITQQVVGIVVCLQVPLLSFAMLQAEFTHFDAPLLTNTSRAPLRIFVQHNATPSLI
jgi:hypothetical protein